MTKPKYPKSTFRLEVSTRPHLPDARGQDICQQINLLGISGVQSVSVTDLYFLQGDIHQEKVLHLLKNLLVDPVTESGRIVEAPPPDPPGTHTVEVTLLPGVTDSQAESLLYGAQLLGISGLQQAASGQRYQLRGDISPAQLKQIAQHLLSNEVIQTYSLNQPIAPPFSAEQTASRFTPHVERIPLTQASPAQLQNISQTRRLSLNLNEMKAVQAYYQAEKREPSDVELEMIAQTWSEHCVHKTFRAHISYQTEDRGGNIHTEEIDSLLKTYLRAATEEINKPWVKSAFVDNAGIISFTPQFDLAFKVETHNHPSALEPFGGANTGVGGVVRDVIGVSARPIANTNILCFGPQDMAFNDLPAGVLHPRRIAHGVIHGVEDYGNKMGIPTVNGAVLYHPGYTANPLVFCGCLGILPVNSHPTEPQPGDLIIALGGNTGRDGLRGATFSSMEMDHQTGEVAGSAVQIGHPIHEKQTLEAILQARDERLYSAITDCGAGGLSSAVGEMAEKLGADIYLERVPLKYPGLQPWEIWLSEAQERMVLAVPAESWPRLQEICRRLDIPATNIGRFRRDGEIKLHYQDQIAGQLSTRFLHDGLPRHRLQAVWTPPIPHKVDFTPPTDLKAVLLALLAQPNTRSKEDIVRRYDHEVQGGTVVKPFIGPSNRGPADAAVLVPLDSRNADGPEKGVALSVGVNPAYGEIDPKAMAWAAIDEAIRNCVAVGANPDEIAILDNFCWGNPNLPDRLGSLVRCAQGCYEAAVAYQTPFVSGKDSLNNEYTGADGQKHAIPGTLVISAMGLVPDVTHTVTSDLKTPGNYLYLLGESKAELGGSSYLQHLNLSDTTVPQPPEQSLKSYRALHQAISAGLVQACHDCSEGGLAVAATEMALAGELGLTLNLADVPGANKIERDDVIIFSESLGRLLIEVSPAQAEAFEACFAGVALARIGAVTASTQVDFIGLNDEPVISVTLAEATHAWRKHLDE